MPNQDFTKIYKEIQLNISDALVNINDIKLKNEKGNTHLKSLISQLDDIRSQFSDEIEFLEKNSEWEKFTIAFFGETNSGKSTIIESLRIIFAEKQRQDNIKANKIKTEEMEKMFSANFEQLSQELANIYESYLGATKTVCEDIKTLSEIVANENNLYKKLIKYGVISAISFCVGMIVNHFFPEVIESIFASIQIYRHG